MSQHRGKIARTGLNSGKSYTFYKIFVREVVELKVNIIGPWGQVHNKESCLVYQYVGKDAII
jgi:hypothetical protein